MKIKRHKTNVVNIGDLAIGGKNPIVIESMTNVDPYDVNAIVQQINQLAEQGCLLVRIALPEVKAASLVSQIKARVKIPLMGDIHFDYRIALEAINQNIDSLRLNPGNIRQKDKIEEIVKRVKAKNIPVRIGVNAGSIDEKKYKHHDINALVKSAMEHVRIFEHYKFNQIIISLKSSNVLETIEAYKKFSTLRNYPLHIGITEAGTKFSGTIKSALGVGILLYEGLGDTIRISLAGDPVYEVIVGYKILKDLGLYKNQVEVIACPTCGRTEFPVEEIANEIEKQCVTIKKNIKVAVMGCVVNGPGEAKDADIGVAGSRHQIILFKKGKYVKTIKEEEIIPEIMGFIKKNF